MRRNPAARQLELDLRPVDILIDRGAAHAFNGQDADLLERAQGSQQDLHALVRHPFGEDVFLQPQAVGIVQG